MDYSLKPIKSIDTSHYEVMLSCSLFKLNTIKGSYRTFYKYCNDFLRWIDSIPKIFYVRMYIDESVLTDESFIEILNRKIKNLEIILFEFKNFKITEKDKINPIFKNAEIFEGTHDGTFGTMARVLSLYNLPEVPSNIKWIWITDIDIPKYIFSYDNVLDLEKNKAKVSFYSKACNNREWFPDTSRYPISAGKTIVSSKIKFDISILETFLNDLLDNKYKDINEKISSKRKELKQHYAPAKYFTYGFDELFLNMYLYDYLTSFKYIVYYEISLLNFKNEETLPYIEKIKKLEQLMWKNPNMNIKKNKLTLLKYNNKIYNLIKNKKTDNYRLDLCVKDYGLYRNNIETDLKNHWGLTSKIIV
jgi:hypothetical protein